MEDYDQQVKAIRVYNQPILAAFQSSLKQTWLTDKTINGHIENIDFLTEFLVYYEPLKRLDETDETDIASFFLDWFPRKAAWASESSIKSNLASFKKFFEWMGQAGQMSAETVTEILTILKEDRDEFLGVVEAYEQALDEWDDEEG